MDTLSPSGVDIVNGLQGEGWLQVIEVNERVDRARSTIRRRIESLEQRGFVESKTMKETNSGKVVDMYRLTDEGREFLRYLQPVVTCVSSRYDTEVERVAKLHNVENAIERLRRIRDELQQ